MLFCTFDRKKCYRTTYRKNLAKSIEIRPKIHKFEISIFQKTPPESQKANKNQHFSR